MRNLTILIAALTTACQVQPKPDSNAANTAAAAPTAPTPVASRVTPAENAMSPTPAPAVPAPSPEPGSTPDADKSPTAAVRVLSDYFAAIATHDFGRAYRMWSGGGQATGMSQAEFAASFARYRAYVGNAGKPGETDGAAGSIYIEIPVKVTGVLARGGGYVLEGPMTLKRVNDVDGSTVEQRRWHIASNGLKPRP